MTNKVKIQEFGKNKQIMVTIPRAIAQLLGFDKGRLATWSLASEDELKLKLEGK